MNVKIAPKILNGVINAPASKSEAHRILICAALSDKKTKIYNLDKNNLNDDINATVNCLEALGAGFEFEDNYVIVRPINKMLVSDKPHVLNCNESGSTLRFMLPVACALYNQVEFTGAGRLPERPLDDLLSVMKSHGVNFSSDKLPFKTQGRLNAGEFKIKGDVSSQYITGLLLAMPLLNNNNSKIILTSQLKSADYVNITLKVLRDFGVEVSLNNNIYKIADKKFNSPESIRVGADWSSAAFYLAAGALGCDVSVGGLDVNSAQGDKKILELLKDFGADVYINEDKIAVNKNNLIAQQIDIDATPDLLPVLAVIAAYAQGETVFYNAARLRLKESDRIKSACDMINALGGQAEEQPDALIVRGSNFNKLTGGFVNGCNDHRIVMAAAIAAVNCNNEVVISDCGAVSKSYINFFDDYKRLGGAVSVV